MIAPNEFDENWKANSEHTIYWRWLINEGPNATEAQDKLDTDLANKATLDEVTIKITIRAEQVDIAPQQNNPSQNDPSQDPS